MSEETTLVQAMMEGKILVAKDQDRAYLVRKTILAIYVATYKARKNDSGNLSLSKMEVNAFQNLREVANFLSTKGDLYQKDIT